MIKKIIFGFVFILMIFSSYSILTDAEVYYSFDEDEVSGDILFDVSGNNINSVCYNMGGDCNTQQGILLNSTFFDATNDYIYTENMSILSPGYSISYWVNQTAFSGTDYHFDTYNIVSGDRMIFGTSTGPGTYEFYTSTDAWTNTGQVYGSIDEWHHLVWVANSGGNIISFYRDGSFVNNYSVTIDDISSNFTLGSNYVHIDAYIHGSIDEFAIWDRSLSSDEITELYNSGAAYNPYDDLQTDIQPYYNLENITININSSLNIDLNYSLDGGSNISIWTNQNNGTLNLNSLTIGSHTITFYDNNSNSLTESFEYQPYQYLYFTNSTGGQIYNFTLNGVDYENYANFTIDSIGSKSFTFSKIGFNTTTFSRTFTINTQLNETIAIPLSIINITIYDIDTLSLITNNVNIDLIGSSFAGSFATSTGNIEINNITNLPGSYELNLESTGYEDLTYYFVHTGYSYIGLTLYMQNSTGTTPITYIVIDRFGDAIDGGEVSCLVELAVYQISSNSYEAYDMDYINSVGQVIFDLDTSRKYKPTITCDGVTKVFNGEKVTSSPVYLTFDESNLVIFPDIPTISSNITYINVSNTTGRFKYTYDDTNNIISQACLNVSQKTTTGFNFIDQQCVATASGSINVDFNITNGYTYRADGYVIYEGETYVTDIYYKKIFIVDFDESIFGILFALIIIGVLSFAGFFAAKAKGLLVGATIGLWATSNLLFGVWNFAVVGGLIIWTALLVVGLIFS